MVKTIGPLLAVSLLVSSTLSAQTLSVGAMPADTFTTGYVFSGAPVSIIDLSHPAAAAGTLNRASVQWSKACNGAFKIVFLTLPFATVSSFTVRAVRGPFNSVAGRNDVALNPPVQVSKGDVIGVVQLQPYAACGGPLLAELPPGSTLSVESNNDMSVNGTQLSAFANYEQSTGWGIIAYSNDPLLVSVVPGAGAVQGNGAFFRTSLQLQNLSGTNGAIFPGMKIDGRVIFHKAGSSAADTDPSLAFTLAPGQVVSYADVITQMGASGLGSLDVVTNGGTPVVTARVFSDGGAAGTSGFSEEGIHPEKAFTFLRRGTMVMPADLTNYRMNVGIRTLNGGASVTITTYNADGTVKFQRTATYAANYFEQVPVNTFAGTTVEAGGTITVFSTGVADAFFLYESVTDNRTQDSALRMATGQ